MRKPCPQSRRAPGSRIFMMGLGLTNILELQAVFGDVVPFVGTLVRSGTAIVAFILPALRSLVVIAIA